jgi:TPR repeat protein
MCTNEFSSIKTDIASVRESIESEDFYERGLELIDGDHYVPKEASQGDLYHPEAAFEYAIHLSTGDVCDKDVIAAAKYFKLYADGGNSDGQLDFGICLSEGIDVGQDLAQSANYFKLSADDGNSNGQYHYGLTLIDGMATWRNDAEGRQYLILSAEQGNPTMQNCVGRMLYELCRTPRDVVGKNQIGNVAFQILIDSRRE